ncbi:MAG TPA: DUF2332 domain-containing protein [Acidimicrobiales bacterium]|nr:DUF2332 domain-containing protein [Acidimicrobiales bacterium]
MDRRADLRDAAAVQLANCADNGSPTWAALVQAMAERLDDADPPMAVQLVLDDPQPALGSAVFLRLFGAVHRLALADESCPLRAWLPSTGGVVDVARAVPTFFDVVAERAEALALDMQAGVQTNEVGRAASLSAALHWIGGPVVLLEVGASAGLNLWLDRFRVEAGAVAWGPPGSPVRLAGQFSSGRPPAGPVEIVERRGSDLNPLDAGNEGDRRLLRSFVWPEHHERRARLDAAFSVAGPLTLDRADACSWLGSQLAALRPGASTVVMHSVVMPYLSRAERDEVRAIISEAGERASASDGARLAWLSFEPRGFDPDMHVVVSRWPEGDRTLVARSRAHGQDVRWLV